jgi:phosphoserine phosphatase RsbU/P
VSEQTGSDRLSNLLAVTDMSLSRLDLQDLLTELLDRVRTILLADTAAVLLREEGSTDLVARAACGLEDEVRQGVTVPIGTGFAGAIAARKEPVLLNRVDASTVTNPILWEKGVRVMLGVPLLSNDDLIGVLHVGRLDDRAFTGEDVELLQVAAQRVAGAAQARQLAVESAAARLLERGLQPTRLPAIPDLRLAGRYVPAENRMIGGDWYDAFTLPSGQLWLVVGDVAGHGLNAAVVMGRVKSALRAYALTTGDPARALELTDRKVQHFEIGTMVTVACATSAPPYDQFQLCSAGHLPPVLAEQGVPARLVNLPLGPPLGALPGVDREAAVLDLPPGGVLVLYTDGPGRATQ